MTLDEINKKLAEIAKTLDEIAWDKEMKEADKTRIEDDVKSFDGIISSEQEFGKEQLDTYVEKVKAAKEKGDTFLKGRDTSKENYGEYKSNERKAELVKDLSGKYDDLFKKKQAIEKLQKKYDPKDLQDYASDKIKNNEIEINKKNNLERNLRAFINNPVVKENLSKIAKNVKEINEFNELKKDIDNLSKEIKTLKSEVSKEKDPMAVAKGQSDINKLEKKRTDLAKKKGITYNETSFKSDIDAKIDPLKDDNKKCRNSIKTILNKQRDEVKNTIGTLPSEPEKVEEYLNDKVLRTEQDKIALRHENNRLSSNISQMIKDLPLGEKEEIRSSYAPFSYNPTNDEIINSDTYKNLMEGAIVPADRKNKIAWRRSCLLKENQNDKKMHPLVWLKSHFGGKILDKKLIKEIEGNAIVAARKDIIEQKQQEAHDLEDAQLKTDNEARARNAFTRNMYDKNAARAILEGKEAVAEAIIRDDFIARNSAEEQER